MIITFVGHGSVCYGDEIFQKVFETVKENIPTGENVSFYCGGYGNFDFLCAKVCRKLLDGGISGEVVLITPYLNAIPCNHELYDGVVYPPLEQVPPRYAISKRNQWMILNADLVIAYVSASVGGAYKTLSFARKKKKNIINLAK